MPTLPLVIMLLIMCLGFAFIVIGAKICFQRKLHYFHRYHTAFIKEKDIPIFAKKSGQAVMAIGFGISLTSLVFILTESSWSWLIFFIYFVFGLVSLFQTISKYNGHIL